MENIYVQKKSTPKLSGMIKSFWLIDSKEDVSIHREKIIPDGYPELIFHYGDAYKTNIDGRWKLQGKNLIAGQIKNHFFLENRGISKMFGIKFQPWTLTELFDIEMYHLTNTVIEVPLELLEILDPIREIGSRALSFDEKIKKVENWFVEYIGRLNPKYPKGQQAVELIIKNNGKLDLKNIQDTVGISERSLERYFRKYIGVSPKYYSRIIRFSHIFKLVQDDAINWADIVFLTGFYDQSHFIKNFQEFTGEDPTKYSFFEDNLANFFLKK